MEGQENKKIIVKEKGKIFEVKTYQVYYQVYYQYTFKKYQLF